MKKGTHYDNAKNVIAFFVVLLAFSIFLIFYTNQDTIMQPGNFYTFMILATVGAALLLYLFYIVSNQTHLSKTKSSVTKSSKKKKKSR